MVTQTVGVSDGWIYPFGVSVGNNRGAGALHAANKKASRSGNFIIRFMFNCNLIGLSRLAYFEIIKRHQSAAFLKGTGDQSHIPFIKTFIWLNVHLFAIH